MDAKLCKKIVREFEKCLDALNGDFDMYLDYQDETKEWRELIGKAKEQLGCIEQEGES